MLMRSINIQRPKNGDENYNYRLILYTKCPKIYRKFELESA